MRQHRLTTRRGRAIFVLASLGAFTCAGGAAYAFAQAGSSPAPAADRAPAGASAAPPSLRLRVAPGMRSVAPRGVVRYTIRIRNPARRIVKLSLRGQRPRRVFASFKPRRTHGERATLTIITSGASSGRHRLRLVARSGTQHAAAAVTLVVRRRPVTPSPLGVPIPVPGTPQPTTPSVAPPADPAPGPGDPAPGNPPPDEPDAPQPTDFVIGGDLSRPLEPGSEVPLDLVLSNPGPVAITVTGLDMSIGAVSAPLAADARPCVGEDFAVTQFSGAYGFTLGAVTTTSLSQLGFSEQQWPRVTMLNRAVNQNGCKGASLRFDFSGTATGDDS